MTTTTGGTVGTFRDRLRDALEKRMLLSAEAVWVEHGHSPSPGGVVFETTSGKWHKQFVTLWPLFADRALFAECADALAGLARTIRDQKGYTTIVTGTAAAKHLMEYVQAQVESDDDGLTVQHLGPYPFLAAGDRGVLNFRGEKVLIVADVLDSGNVVRNLAKAVRDLNGDPVAALCLVAVNETLIEGMKNGEMVIEIGPGSRDRLRVHTLTDYPLPEIPSPIHPGDGLPPQPSERIKLDPETLRPVPPAPRQPGVPPAIDQRTMYRQFEDAGAIGFDFYRTEAGLLMTGVRFAKLFDRAGDAIWEKIKDHFNYADGPDFKPPLVVTTFDWGDMLFKEFVEKRLAADRKELFAFAGRRDDGEYFVLHPGGSLKAHRRVVLLLSSVQSGQKLRELVTLLAGLEVPHIDVVCLLNRMGRRTAEFLRLTQQVVRGLGDVKEPTGTAASAPFQFFPVYGLYDLSTEDIRCAQDTIRALFDYYQSETRVPSFRRWVNQLWAYFEAKSLTRHAFTEGRPDPLDSPVEVSCLDRQPFAVETVAAKLSLLCAHAAADREYGPILEELQTTGRKHTLFKLFAVLLSDVSHLRMMCQFSQLRKILKGRVEACRVQRFALEDAARKARRSLTKVEGDQIDELIELETHLFFGWALFSYQDHNFEYGDLAWQVVTCGNDTVANWNPYPENFARYFGEERVAWTVSLLLLLSYPRFRTSDRSTPIREKLTTYVKELLNRVQVQIEPQRVAEPRPRLVVKYDQLLKIKSNLDMLLTELGAHELRLPATVVRFLHSQLLKDRPRHSPIVTNMENVLNALRAVVETGPGGKASPNRRLEIPAKYLPALDDGIHIAGQLQTLAEAVHRLFFFSSASGQDAGRFTATPDEQRGFAADVGRLGDMLQAIRKDKRVSLGELEKLERLSQQILTDLWDDQTSFLRRTLARYVVPLEPEIITAMVAAKRLFRRKWYQNVWDDHIRRFQAVPPGSHHYVLIEPLLLREILKNLFTNVRYNLQRLSKRQKAKVTLLDRVQIEVIEMTDLGSTDAAGSDPAQMVLLRLVSVGKKYDPHSGAPGEGSTFDQHRRNVSKYDGMLQITSLPHRKREGTQVELSLVSRQAYRPKQ
jgi:hypothetical protein